MKRFALIGAAGYIAPRHMKAIKETGNVLVAALDKADNVGVLDSYFPDCQFFTEFERFDRHLDKLRRKGEGVDYVSICSPNYLHDSHIRFALRLGADAICEKPLVLNPWNAEALAGIEKETGRRVNTILQLRLHPNIISLKERVEHGPRQKKYELNLDYITSRGPWYQVSWKGDATKSGGIATNIGIHFFDMLMWIFGEVKDVRDTKLTADEGSGFIELEKANVKWHLSINSDHLPEHIASTGRRTYRSLRIANEEIEFSDGFTELHTLSYRQVISGNGFGLSDALPSIELVHRLRTSSLLV
jgi:UDP-N-acetyl-2-amino-2-deoxyglucuronate dehydrogenase